MTQIVPPYQKLAAEYDEVMHHVDYEKWAYYAEQLITHFKPDARSILELGCGTGSLAFYLQPQGPYRYTATDRSERMIQQARRKRDEKGADVRFRVSDFTSPETFGPVDVVLLLYDGLNYITDPAGLQPLFAHMYRALAPGGIAIFDQSTPANSLDNAPDFADRGHTSGAAYVRRSRYDADSRLHTTTFDLIVEGESYRERHVQRAYGLEEIRREVERSLLVPLAAFDGRSRDPATEAAHRIHWITSRPPADSTSP